MNTATGDLAQVDQTMSQTEAGSLGIQLRRHRVAAAMTQEELAAMAGLSVRALRNIEQGHTLRPFARSVRLLADALELAEPARSQLIRALEDPPPDANAVEPAAIRAAGLSNREVLRQLPAVARRFTGRAAELRILDRLLDESADGNEAVVISAIGGTAGVGKTALAVRWAHRVASRFPDGQLYANLRGYDTAAPLPAADVLLGFLRCLGVAGQDIPAETDERAAMYRSLLAGRRMLLLLDNAREANQVRPLLPGTPGCVAVVTSRDSLVGLVASDGAQRLDLDLLPLVDATNLLRSLIGARVDAEPQATAAIAAWCCRLPLALRLVAELAAARPSVSLCDLTEELADDQRRLDLLDAGGDAHTAVRSVFSWSYRHLSADAAKAFRTLGLHPGAEFDVYGAAVLCGVELAQARRLITQLARAYLIQPTQPGRYVMHDLLRSYAAELGIRCDAQTDRRVALTRLFDYYVNAADAAIAGLYPAEQLRHPSGLASGAAAQISDAGKARAWLDAERANLVAVAAYMTERGWPGHATRLAGTLFRYLEGGCYSPDAATIHAHACRAARQTGDAVAEAAALASLGLADLRQGRYRQAAGQLRQALALSRKVGDQTGEMRALGNLGIVAFQEGRYRQAASNYRQALALARRIGDPTGEASALVTLGTIYLRQGRHRQASSRVGRALALYREIGNRAYEAYALEILGLIYLRQGCYEQATEHTRRALALARTTGNHACEGYALANLGEIDLKQGRFLQATNHNEQALALFRDIGDRSGEAQALSGLGAVGIAFGQVREARVQYSAALALARQIGDKYQQACAHAGLGYSYGSEDAPEQARHHLDEALILYTSLGDPESSRIRAQLTQNG